MPTQLNLQIGRRPLGKLTTDPTELEKSLKSENARVLPGAGVVIIPGLTKALDDALKRGNMKSMKIHKALKVKNRLVGEVAKLQQIVARENSRRNDNPSTVDVVTVGKELDAKRNELIKLKGAISQATAPITPKLAELEETKNEINFIQCLPCREGEELVGNLRQGEPIRYEWKATLNRQAIDDETAKLQERINQLQDEIDEFNAKTDVVL